MSESEYARSVIRDVFGMNPDEVEADWASDLSWCVMQYGELKAAHMWSEYLINVDHYAGYIDDLEHRRELNELNETWSEDIDDIKTQAWNSIGGYHE